MRILWLARKQMDVAMDRGTWTNMFAALRRDNTLFVVTGRVDRQADLGPGVEAIDTPALPYANGATFLVRLAARLPALLERTSPDAVIVDPETIRTVATASAQRYLSRNRVLVSLDVRSLPIESTWIREMIDWRVLRGAVRTTTRHSYALSTITFALAEQLATMGGPDVHEIGLWSSGVDTHLFDPARFPERRDDRTVFMYHGSIRASRGVLSLARAWRLVQDKAPAARLVVMGQGPDVPALKDLVRREGLSGSVEVREPVDPGSVPEEISTCDFGVIPLPDQLEWRVSSPLKLFEYLSMGRPVVATDIRCNRDVLGQAPYAVYAASDREDALADAVIRACADRQRLATAAAEGRELVERRFTWSAQSASLVRHLQRNLPAGGAQ